MRYASAIVLLAFSSTANAATLTFERTVHLGGGGAIAPPLDIRWELENVTDPLATPFSFTVEDLEPADAGTTYTLDASTAASYSVDWPALVAASETTDWRYVDMTWGSFIMGDYPINAEEAGSFGLLSFSIERVEISLLGYQHNGMVSSLNDLVMRSRTIGEGELVPEPAGVLTACACVGLLWRRNR